VNAGLNEAIAGRARAGEPLTAAEIDELASSDLLSLGMLADEVRRSRVGDTVTYRRVWEIDVRQPPAAEGTGRTAAAGVEVRLTGLLDTLDETESRVGERRTVAGPRRLTGFALADLVERSAAGWGALTDVLSRLKAAGLDAIAEAAVDRVPDLETALQACADAALPVACLSFDRPDAEARTDRLLRVRALAGRFSFLTTVAPLARTPPVAAPTTGYDDVRGVALARLVLPGVRNIQVDWAQYGPKLAQVALTFGANDLDRVSPYDDLTLGPRRTAVEDVRRNIIAAGFTPADAIAGA
jgi:2-iminoacetate synthase ThiH